MPKSTGEFPGASCRRVASRVPRASCRRVPRRVLKRVLLKAVIARQNPLLKARRRTESSSRFLLLGASPGASSGALSGASPGALSGAFPGAFQARPAGASPGASSARPSKGCRHSATESSKKALVVAQNPLQGSASPGASCRRVPRRVAGASPGASQARPPRSIRLLTT